LQAWEGITPGAATACWRVCYGVEMGLLHRLILAATMLALFRPHAHAQEPEFNDVIKRAVVEFDQGHWEEASALFRQAHELNPSARTWRGLGLTSFELRRYVNAIAELEAALADPRKPLTNQQRKEVETVLGRAREFVSVYRVRVQPSGAEVIVDGHPATLNQGQLFLDPGPHTLLVRASGYEERREDLRAAAGAKDELSIELSVTGPAEEVALEAAAPAEARPDEPPPPKRRRVWTWVLGGASVAAGAAAIGLGVATDGKSEDFKQCGATPDCQDIADKGKSLQLGTNLSIGLAGAFLVGAVTAFFLEGRARPAEEKRAQLLLSPSAIALRTRF
jgi:tetratricopeptide (TPR) repeat protein